MEKYLILDMGKVLVWPSTGSWYITPVFLKNVDMTKIDQDSLEKAIDKYKYILNEKAVTIDEEYIVIGKFFKNLFKELEYDISEEKIKTILDDFVYNLSDTKYYLYDDVKEELERLSKKYTLLMLSDNWPCGEEYLKKHDIHKYFKKIYISSVYGCMKEDKIFFDYLINDFNINKGDALYVDDREDLLDIGVEKGLNVLHMDRENEFSNSKYKRIHNLKEI